MDAAHRKQAASAVRQAHRAADRERMDDAIRAHRTLREHKCAYDAHGWAGVLALLLCVQTPTEQVNMDVSSKPLVVIFTVQPPSSTPLLPPPSHLLGGARSPLRHRRTRSRRSTSTRCAQTSSR